LKEKVIYYSDELNDDFANTNIIPVKINGDYKYIRKNIFWKIGHFILYRLFATPFAFLYTKLKFHHKIENKEDLKKIKKEGYFLYGNHTQKFADAFIPSMLTYSKRAYLIVHPDSVSIKGLKNVTPMLGALPLPSCITSTKNFLYALEKRTLEGNVVVIYPEAHIWPYYTKIRNFKSSSFKYPIKFETPTFCFTNTYQKRKFSKKPKIVTYIDGPFYPDNDLPLKEREIDLRNRIFETMKYRSEKNEIEYVKYVKK